MYPGYPNETKKVASFAFHYIIKELLKLGNEVRVVSLWPDYPKSIRYLFSNYKYFLKYSFPEVFTFEKVKVKREPLAFLPKIGTPENRSILCKNSIMNWLDQERFSPEIIISIMINPAKRIAELISKRCNVPLVLSVHSSDLRILNRRKFSSFDQVEAFVFHSKSIVKKFRDLVGLTEDKFFINYFGIDSEIVPDSLPKKESKNIIPTILTVCSLIPLKNTDSLINAFRTMESKACLKIIGDGPERKNLEKLVKNCNLSEKVFFLGELTRERVIEEMRKAVIFAMVSAPETFGLVYPEAMANGCLTIGSKGEGIDGIIVDGKNGYLCEPKNEKDLARLLDSLLALKEEKKVEIRKNALDTVMNLTNLRLAINFDSNLKQILHKFREIQKERKF